MVRRKFYGESPSSQRPLKFKKVTPRSLTSYKNRENVGGVLETLAQGSSGKGILRISGNDTEPVEDGWVDESLNLDVTRMASGHDEKIAVNGIQGKEMCCEPMSVENADGVLETLAQGSSGKGILSISGNDTEPVEDGWVNESLNLDVTRMASGHDEKIAANGIQGKEMCCESMSPDIPQGNTKEKSIIILDDDTEPILVCLEDEILDLTETRMVSGHEEKAISNYMENDSAEVLDVIRYLESTAEFKESFEQFSIRVNGLAIDYEFSKQFRAKYYELCCSQKSFLHEHLHEHTSCKLVAAIIYETINIADEIKASKLTTCLKNFPALDKTLKSFEALGMNVGFLRARMERLGLLACELLGDAEATTYREAKKLEVDRIEGEVKTLEARIMELKSARKRLEMEIEALEMSPKKAELVFQEEAGAPW